MSYKKAMHKILNYFSAKKVAVIEFNKDDSGEWVFVGNDSSNDENSGYKKQVLSALKNIDTIFQTARNVCEFEFIWTLLSMRSEQDSGWDPYETTVTAISEVLNASNSSNNQTAQKHLQLWLYVHIMEASEPYEKIANLLEIANGNRFNPNNFPPKKNGWQLSPGEKIKNIQEKADLVKLSDKISFLNSIWDRTLRNSISHAEYAFYPNEMRTFRPNISRPRKEVANIINRAIAYHYAFQSVHSWYVSSYTSTKLIQTHPNLSPIGPQPALVIVRKGHGVIGLRDGWTQDEIDNGAITWMAARLNESEQNTLLRYPSRTEF